MPFAGYKNFSACLIVQKNKGHSDESAHKICGYLKNKLEKNTDMHDTKKNKAIKNAETVIEKARMVVKPTNPKGYIVGNIQSTGSASMDPKKAGKLNDVRGLKKEDSAVETTQVCTYCGSSYSASSETDEDRATGMILDNTNLTGTDKLPTPDATDGVPVEKKAFAVRLQKSMEAEEEHYILGVVLEPEVLDSQGDIYSADEIRKSAHMFMQNFANIGLQHNGHINDKAKILESYIAPTDFSLNEQTIRKGTWLLGARILDDELWQSIKKGEITGWSIGGSANRTPIGQTN